MVKHIVRMSGHNRPESTMKKQALFSRMEHQTKEQSLTTSVRARTECCKLGNDLRKR